MQTPTKKPDRSAYQYAWNKTNSKYCSLKLNRHTDTDILEKLSTQENIQGYIKRLIREDIERSAE